MEKSTGTLVVVAALGALLLTKKGGQTLAERIASGGSKLRIPTEKSTYAFLGRIAPYEIYIDKAAFGEWGSVIDSNIIRAVIWTESSGDATAKRKEVTGQTAHGLMQITEEAAHEMGFRGLDDALFMPGMSIKYGTLYLYAKLKELDGDMYDAIAAYNAGAGRIRGQKDAGVTHYSGYANASYVDQVVLFFNALRKTEEGTWPKTNG